MGSSDDPHPRLSDTNPQKEAPRRVAESTVADNRGGEASEQVIARGQSIGRYVVLDEIGRGAMGVVYRAYDPELDRRVALKLLRARGDATAAAATRRARLKREAQAMARLSHPNVAVVHEVGSIGDDVYIAMEMVDGPTLAELAGRPWEEIVQAYRAAGRGLVAAHAAGLVHRDFKPDNARIGPGGRVRVLDFGLARLLEADAPPPEDLPESAVSSERAIVTPLTRDGAVVGTPAYMSPEALRGGATDERSDQFSFCAALYEALYGRRAFRGTTLADLRRAIEKQQPVDPPKGTQVPAWVHRVVARGLSADPARRFPDMNALLAELERDPATSRRRLRLAVAGIAGLAASLIALVALRHPRGAGASVCNGFEARLGGVWDAPRRAAVRAAFEATGVPYAADVFQRTAAAIDEHAESWVAARRAACAAHERHELSEGMRERRDSCLDERLGEVDELVRAFMTADVGVVRRAVQAVQHLPRPEVCTAAAALRLRSPVPGDLPGRALLEQTRLLLARSTALRAVGRMRAALVVAEAARAAAQTLGSQHLEASAASALTVCRLGVGDFAGAQTAADDTLYLASAGGDDLLIGRTAADVVAGLANDPGHRREAAHWARLGQGALVRAGGDEDLEAQITLYYAYVEVADGRLDQAVADATRAAAVLRHLYGEVHAISAEAWNVIGRINYARGDLAATAAAFERALALYEKLLGPDHPATAKVASNVGAVLIALGRYQEARVRFQSAVDVLTRALGPDHPDVGTALENLGIASRRLGDYEAAAAAYQRALAIQEKAYGPDAPELAEILDATGVLEHRRGRDAEARVVLERALLIKQRTMGPAEIAQTVANLGDALLGLGDARGALERYTHARDLAAKVQGDDHSFLAYPLTGIGQAELALGQPLAALEPLERALALREAAHVDPAETAETRFALARALRALGRDPARVKALADGARDAFAAAPRDRAPDLAEVEKFLTVK